MKLNVLVVTAVALAASPLVASAQDASDPPGSRQDTDLGAIVPATQPLKAADTLDFDLLGSPASAAAEEIAKAEQIQNEAKRRKTMLTVHQALGFTLMGMSSLNMVFGILNYWDKFGGGGHNRTFEIPHLVTALSVTALFGTNALLALFAPDPYPKPGRWDTARIHRIFMFSALGGVLTQVVLGFISASREGNYDQRQFATAHLGVGIATYVLTVAGGLTYLF